METCGKSWISTKICGCVLSTVSGGHIESARPSPAIKSFWSPKYFPKQLIQYANTLLKDRVLFGSDYPLITPERWIKDFEVAGFKPEVMPGILKGNAVRLLGLDAA